MSPHLSMTLKIVIRLVTVSVSYLILHQEFYLIKIYHVGVNFNVLTRLLTMWVKAMQIQILTSSKETIF